MSRTDHPRGYLPPAGTTRVLPPQRPVGYLAGVAADADHLAPWPPHPVTVARLRPRRARDDLHRAQRREARLARYEEAARLGWAVLAWLCCAVVVVVGSTVAAVLLR